MSRIAQTIYLYRLENKITQKDLALKSGVPQPNISMIEKGRDFKISTLYKLAAALGVSASDLLSGLKPVIVNKKALFERDNIEALVYRLAHFDKDRDKSRLVKLLATAILASNPGKKNLDLAWVKLKKTFTREEFNAILSRLNKAKQRKAAHAGAD